MDADERARITAGIDQATAAAMEPATVAALDHFVNATMLLLSVLIAHGVDAYDAHGAIAGACTGALIQADRELHA